MNIDPENHQCLMETSLPTPTTARVYVNIPEGISIRGCHLSIQPKRLFASTQLRRSFRGRRSSGSSFMVAKRSLRQPRRHGTARGMDHSSKPNVGVRKIWAPNRRLVEVI